MTSTKNLVFLVTLVALAISLVASVSAFGQITSVEVAGVEGLPSGSADIAVFAGQTVPVRVVFEADNLTDSVRDVRVKAWIVGDRELAVSSERFVVDSGKTYSRLVSVQVPSDLDSSEDLDLVVSVESRNDGVADEQSISLGGQRESYVVEILDVDFEPQVKAGDTLALDVVLKNRGREEAEDTFVRARIPSLGIEDRGYFGDLSEKDQSDPDKEDSSERRLFLRVPANTPAGVYVVEIDAFNSDSATTISKRVAVVSAGDDSIIVSPVSSRTFGSGETGKYSLTLVNTGSNVAVYELVVEAPAELNVEVSETVLAIPAGTSRTVQIDATSSRADDYAFAVNVHSDGQLVTTKQFMAKVTEGRTVSTGNATVLLTVVLAIIFIVLLVVLIVLLTRRPEKSEEFGESYY